MDLIHICIKTLTSHKDPKEGMMSLSILLAELSK